MSEALDFTEVIEARIKSLLRDRRIEDLGLPLSGWRVDLSRLETSVNEIEYDKINVLSSPQSMASSTFINDTDLPANQSFSNSKTTTATASWSVTKAMNFGASVSTEVKIPFIAKASLTLSASLSMTKGETKSVSEAQTWNWNVTIPTPPRSRVEAMVLLEEVSFSPKFKAHIRFLGEISFRIGSDEEGFVETTIPIGEFFSRYPHDEFLVVGENVAEYIVEGEFHGVQGLGYLIQSKQFDLETGEPSGESELMRLRRFDTTGVELISTMQSTIGPPDGILCRVMSEKEYGKWAVECGFNDLGLPNSGLFKVTTRSCEEWQNGTMVRSWIEEVETFVRCIPV